MTIGTAASYFPFFPEDRIPDALQVVLDSWKILGTVKQTDLEDSITERLAAAIKCAKAARRLSFSVHYQTVPLDDHGAVAARIDFKFLAGYDEDAYLAFECKRLRIPRTKGVSSNCSEYVGQGGMGRFISGKYAPTQSNGTMVGYVMDGNVAKAKQGIVDQIWKQRLKLRLVSGKPWEASLYLPKQPDLHQTRHKRKIVKSKSDITLQHLFLSV